MPEYVLIAFPINCVEEEGKYILLEEQVRKFVLEFKTLLEHDSSDDSDYSHFSESQQPM